MKRTYFRAAVAVLLAGTLTVPAMAAPLLPDRMQPDTILTYDEDLNPIVLQGGYLPEEAYQLQPPERTILPPSATEEDARIWRLSDQAAAIRYFDLMAGYAPEEYLGGMTFLNWEDGTLVGLTYTPEAGVYPGMRVEYWHDGSIQNIYYPDEECGGYSLHAVPPEDAERAKIRTPSAAFPVIRQMRAIVDWFHQK